MSVNVVNDPITNHPDLMRVELVPIDTLILDPENVKVHNERNIKDITFSLQKYKQYQPLVVDKDNVIRIGNGRWMAAKRLGWQYINIIRTTAEGDDLVALSIIDNRTSETSQWDVQALLTTLEKLEKKNGEEYVVNMGFVQQDIDKILSNLADKEEKPKKEKKKNFKLETMDLLGAPIVVTKEHRIVIDQAIAKLRDGESDFSITEGRCIELICAEYLSGK